MPVQYPKVRHGVRPKRAVCECIHIDEGGVRLIGWNKR
jgi:hypothetical protein